jgi:hypothetical protein
MPSRRLLACAIIVAGLVGVGLSLADASSAARSPLVLLFLVTAPAMAVGGLLRGLDTFARIFVAILGAVVIDAGVPETMLTVHLWSPRASLVVIVLITAILGLVQVPEVRSWLSANVWSRVLPAARSAGLAAARVPPVRALAGWLRADWVGRP